MIRALNPYRELRPTHMSGRIQSLNTTMLNGSAPLVFTATVYETIRTTVGSHPAETGRALGGARGSAVVEEFYFDESSAMTAATYYPDIERLNDMFRDTWNPAGINLLGVVHGHPAGSIGPSRPDVEYADRIMDAIPELDRFVLPIAQSMPDTGAFTLRSFAGHFRDGGRVRLDELDTIVLAPRFEQELNSRDFDRVRLSYDLQVMDHARIVAIGGGGSASFLEDMARAGIGEIVIIDPDIVEACNVATQQAYRSDIGRPKAASIAERLINVRLPDGSASGLSRPVCSTN